MTYGEMREEANRLNDMADEVLSFNLQGATSDDHIGAAEALLAFYEQSSKLQLTLLQETDKGLEHEGSLILFRNAADLHLKIAAAKS